MFQNLHNGENRVSRSPGETKETIPRCWRFYMGCQKNVPRASSDLSAPQVTVRLSVLVPTDMGTQAIRQVQ